MSRPGLIGWPHHGQLVSCAGVPLPPIALPQTRFAILLDGFGGVFGPVGRAALPHPQADAERLRPPLRRVFTADEFAGADEGGGALKLLQGEQPQRVAHQHRHARVTGIAADLALQASNRQRESGHTQIGFGLAAARGKPQQISQGRRGVAAIRMRRIDEAGQVEQHESQLEGIPRALARHIDPRQIDRAGRLSRFARIARAHALLPHSPIGKAKGFGSLWITAQQIDAGADAGQRDAALLEGVFGIQSIGIDRSIETSSGW